VPYYLLHALDMHTQIKKSHRDYVCTINVKLSWVVEANDHNMNNTRVPKLVYEYVQTGRRNVG